MDGRHLGRTSLLFLLFRLSFSVLESVSYFASLSQVTYLDFDRTASALGGGYSNVTKGIILGAQSGTRFDR